MEHHEEEFAALDALVEYLKTLPPGGPRILVPERMEQFVAAYRAAKRMTSATEGTICSELRENEGWASFTVETPELVWGRGDPLPPELMWASNLEIYPLTNGNLRLSAMFYGLTRAIDLNAGSF